MFNAMARRPNLISSEKIEETQKKKHRNLLHAIPGWLGQNEHVKNDNFYILVQFVVGIRDHYDGTGD